METFGALSPQNNSLKEIEEFFERQRKWLEGYARDSAWTIANGDKVGLDTFAIDLDKRTMYFSPRFWTENGFEPEHALFATLHELEHLKELVAGLSQKGGARAWQKNRDKIKKSKAYGIMDNCYDDIKMNRSVSHNAPVLSSVPEDIYTKKLFPNTDMTELPKHLQFAYALVRDANVGENSIVSDDVRGEIENLKNYEIEGGEKVDLLEMFSRPETEMADRISFQERFLEPLLKKFLEEDKKDPKFQDKEEDKNDDDKSGKEQGDAGDEGDKGDTNDVENGEGKPKDKGEGDPDKIFKRYYDDFDAKNPKPKELDDEEMEEKIKKYIENQNSKKSPEQIAEDAYAKKEGVDPKDYREYQAFKKKLEDIRDLETGRSAVEELREQLRRIVADRLQRVKAPRYPVDEGERLYDPVGAFVSVKKGDLKPAVWEVANTRENPRKIVSNFDLHIVSDLSGSMDQTDESGNSKLLEQRKAVAIVMEALKDLYEELEDQKEDIDKPLSVRSECITFGSDVSTIKKLGAGLTEKERVEMYKRLGEAPGSTKDFLAIEKIKNEIDKTTEDELKSGQRKKLVIVTTDGQSDYVLRLSGAIKELRDKGAVVFGVGITKDGKDTTVNYAPDGFLAIKADELPLIFKRILDKELREI